MSVLNREYNSVDKIVVTKSTGGIYPLILFYSRYDPSTYQKEGSPKDTSYDGFGKYYFVPQICPSSNNIPQLKGQTKIIYIDNPLCKSPKGMMYKKITIIHREDNTPAFRVVYGNPVHSYISGQMQTAQQ